MRYDGPRPASPGGTPAGRDLGRVARGKGGPELGFTLGRFDLDRLGEQEVFVALVGQDGVDERVVGFVTWLPYAGGDAAVLDLMRRGERVPPGVMETPRRRLAGRLRCPGAVAGEPGRCPAGRHDRAHRPGAQLLGWLYEHGDAVYAAKGLFAFKDKFEPSWEPMYLAYPRAADVPRIAVAALRAFLPPGAVREFLRSQQPAPSQAAPVRPQGPPS